MKPFDPRLTRHARAARGYLAATVALGVGTTALVLAQATLLAHVIVRAGHGATAVHGSLIALAVVVLLRAATTYGAEAAALRAAASVKSQLRRQVTARIAARGPVWLAHQHPGELATLLTRGLDALDPYFARYLPQLALSCLVPIAVLVRVAGADLVSAITIGVTLPLIPLFMALVGMHTRARTERQWSLLVRLGGHFLDVVQGLPTLKVFGRAKAQAEAIHRVTEEHRRATMSTLRVAFMSALVLELLATLATALVAVEVGLRLLAGNLGYETAMLVLLLAPEAYLPLRAVGAQFHASMEGVTAAQQALDLLEEPAVIPPPATPRPVASSPADGGLAGDIHFEHVELRYAERDRPALDRVSFVIRPGDRVAVVGASGAGKSSLLALLLRFTEPTAGRITVGGVDLSTVDADEWRRRIAWVPQRPHLFAGTIADNIRLAAPDATGRAIRAAAAAAGLVDPTLPAGLETLVGEGGQALSSGQRQRVAVARAFLRDAPLLLLDEPTAHLDADTAAHVQESVRRLASGRTVLVVSHVHGWAADAGRILHLEAARLSRGPRALAS